MTDKYKDWIVRYYANHDSIPEGHHDGEIVRELIRCKDCKWHKPKYPGERPTCLIYLGDWHDDDYCSRAEREPDNE